jgi:hypothetical protein
MSLDVLLSKVILVCSNQDCQHAYGAIKLTAALRRRANKQPNAERSGSATPRH